MAELIRLDRRPAPGCHMVSINALSPVTSYAKLRGCLEECGGLLDNLVLHRPDSTRQYAMAQFFCESDAERCRQQFDGRWIDGVRVDARRYNASGGRKRPRAPPRLSLTAAARTWSGGTPTCLTRLQFGQVCDEVHRASA